MVYRWNATVKKTDIVYSVGDFIWYEIQGEHLLARFNGKIIFIDGNHGVECNFPETKHHIKFKYRGYYFLLIHDPKKIPWYWNGWVIHGHKHNNDMKNYPFINGDKKTINVSVELIDL
jgi:calcineurin-like phosphoesterase family protein